MKLLSLELLSAFKSLEPFEKFTFSHTDDINVHQCRPICFAGVNGSGKSNMIELLAEIFCYLELVNINYKSISTKAKQTELRFVLEYQITRNGKLIHVIVSKKNTSTPLFFKLNNDKAEPIQDSITKLSLLPERIIGYSSGLNETLKFPFYKNQANYSEEILEAALSEEQSKQSAPVIDTRSLFMSYDCNALILISNYLFADVKDLDIFEKYLRIKSLDSFRIAINFKPKSKIVKLTNEIQEIVRKLCEITTFKNIDLKNNGYIDYKCNDITRERFQKSFETAENLFISLYKLYLLNPIALSKKERTFYKDIDVVNSKYLHTPPEVSPEDKVFKIDQIRVKLTKPDKTIDYIGVSDGEHQLLQALGTVMLFKNREALFLFDEPETHLNPIWRTNFIHLLESISNPKRHEFVISTHSPFIVSDCKGKDVVYFERPNKDESKVRFAPIDFETFGSSYDYLLMSLFKMKALVPERVKLEMIRLVETENIEEIKKGTALLGESFEKRFLYEKIAELEKKQMLRLKAVKISDKLKNSKRKQSYPDKYLQKVLSIKKKPTKLKQKK